MDNFLGALKDFVTIVAPIYIIVLILLKSIDKR